MVSIADSLCRSLKVSLERFPLPEEVPPDDRRTEEAS
jgi:hypothetical protein